MKAKKADSFWKRYSALLIALGISLAIAATMTVVSVWLGERIGQGVVIRDVGGKQRTASQIGLRVMLEMELDLLAGKTPSPDLMKELRDRTTRINNTINAFYKGGTIPEEPGKLPLKPDEFSEEIVRTNAEIDKIWRPYNERIQRVLDAPAADPKLLSEAIDHGRSAIAELQKKFTILVDKTQTQNEVDSRTLTLVQNVGAGLLLLNFLFTIFVALGRLRAGDRAVAQSHKQTDDILATVKEGLFLVSSDFSIGAQMSQALPQIMQRRVEPGMSLIEVLRPMVAASTLEATRDYLGLLFGKRVKENLVASLNPLSEVPVAGGSDGRGQAQPRYLNFQFNRVQEGDDTVHLLVTVSDATERVRLTQEIAAAKTRTREEMESLLRVLSRDSSEVRFFLHRIGVVLERINDDLRQAAGRRGGTDYVELVNAIFRDVHSLKSEAAALNLEMLEALAHNFEVDLISLRDRGEVEGGDMVKMTVHLDDMFECATTIREFLDRISGGNDARAPVVVTPAQRLVEGWAGLAERIAREQGKQVQLQMQLDGLERVPADTLAALRAIGLQLLRNAVAHGIEPAQERTALDKPAAGSIVFRSADAGSRQIELSVRDDGRGIDVARVRAALAASGRYTPEQLQALSDRDAMMKIFEPGVSTAADSGDRDAGHGVGMDLVMKQVRAMAGTISMSTKVGAYTEFRIRLPVAEAKPAAATAEGGDFQLTF
ncbi:ATP-binding protein [Lysobacter enzymogenes]|uniref:histidine kinase n=1 Tax=Lysobacter enzymogenes TaxID=69 RepID=A0AAU9AGD6_LYSEN|nr:ATP-binding protein [Lysobacter enzymogenes]BAV96694.1 CheA signal transduction histidine kinase [Lysobacter enzymogenes]